MTSAWHWVRAIAVKLYGNKVLTTPLTASASLRVRLTDAQFEVPIPMTSRVNRTVIAAALIAILVTTWILFDRKTDGSAPPSGTSSETAGLSPSAVGPGRAQRGPRGGTDAAGDLSHRPAFSMPAINAPLQQVYPALRAEAAAGNPRAACRLAFELQRCAFLPKQREAAAHNEEQVSPRLRTTEPGRRALLEESRERSRRELEVADAVCAGFVAPQGELQPWEYLLAAAQAGHEPSAVRYVSGGNIGLDLEHPLRSFDAWAAYRREAPAIAERSIAAGSPEAYLWVAFSSLGGWYGMELAPRDPVRAAALYMALRDRAAPRYLPELNRNITALMDREKLNSADLLNAKALATQLARQLKAPPEGVDLSQGMFPSEDGSHCAL